MVKLARFLTAGSATGIFLSISKSVFAQTATLSAGGGTNSALLDAGTRELTLVLFFSGLALFVFGSLKIVASFRD